MALQLLLKRHDMDSEDSADFVDFISELGIRLPCCSTFTLEFVYRLWLNLP